MLQRPKMLNEKERNNSPLSVLTTVLFAVVFLLLVAAIGILLYLRLNCFVVEVVGESMENTFFGGDKVYAEKTNRVKRGDVVIIDVSEYEGTTYHFTGKFIIKRVIATEGDRVRCENGTVEIAYAGSDEFIRLKEDYVKGGVSANFEEVTVGAGEIFFLGDNRLISLDSHLVGCMSTETVSGVIPDWAVAVKNLMNGFDGLHSAE